MTTFQITEQKAKDHHTEFSAFLRGSRLELSYMTPWTTVIQIFDSDNLCSLYLNAGKFHLETLK